MVELIQVHWHSVTTYFTVCSSSSRESIFANAFFLSIPFLFLFERGAAGTQPCAAAAAQRVTCTSRFGGAANQRWHAVAGWREWSSHSWRSESY